MRRSGSSQATFTKPTQAEAMNASAGSPQERDRKIRLARRMRAGVISAGVAGSLGLAGGIAVTATNHSTGHSTDSATGKDQASRQLSDDDSDDSESSGRSAPLGGTQAPPSLQQGLGGSSHGSTGGS